MLALDALIRIRKRVNASYRTCTSTPISPPKHLDSIIIIIVHLLCPPTHTLKFKLIISGGGGVCLHVNAICSTQI